MNVIILIYKRCFIGSSERKLYNFTIFSWKFLLLITLGLMTLSFLKLDSTKSIIQLIQVILSGFFISIVTYVATIVYPERNRVEKIIKLFEKDFFRDLHTTLLEIRSNGKDINFLVENIVFPSINVLENSLGLITRQVGINRCIDNRKGLLKYTYFIKKELKKTISLCQNYDENEIEIKETIKLIRKVYRNEILCFCKEIEKYYFLDLENSIKSFSKNNLGKGK